MWLQRDQFTNSQIPLSDLQLIQHQHSLRLHNHPASESSKASDFRPHPPASLQVGDLVYITSDGSRTHARSRYLVVSIHGLWCNVGKFADSQLRSTSYRVKLSECYRLPDQMETMLNFPRRYNTVPQEVVNEVLVPSIPPSLFAPPITEIPQNITPALIPEELDSPPEAHGTSLPAPVSSPAPKEIVPEESSFSSADPGPRRSSRHVAQVTLKTMLPSVYNDLS